ncbi:hypothetical protein [Streptomyces sp. YIM B13518]|uniref:hypothetical protein n=1 Tax=Streptomyces sp. YIM B13518 TaxID=3366316 RepID=UPI0036C55D25
MAGDLVRLAFAEQRRVHVPVAGRVFRLADALLRGVPDDGSVGRPVRQSRASRRVGADRARLTAETSVAVPHGGLLVVVRRAPRATKPRGFVGVDRRRAGTRSGVVVRDEWARRMPATPAGGRGRASGSPSGRLTRTARLAGGATEGVVP